MVCKLPNQYSSILLRPSRARKLSTIGSSSPRRNVRLWTHLLYRTHQITPIYKATPSEEELRVDWMAFTQWERDGDMVIKRTPTPDAKNCSVEGQYCRMGRSFVCPWAQKKSHSLKEQLGYQTSPQTLPNSPVEKLLEFSLGQKDWWAFKALSSPHWKHTLEQGLVAIAGLSLQQALGL